ncbi:cation channel family protein (macronuclear) [Tetrahymena thermophila SB210]|uniref:Cation channel family protein n=1 Tax=Tetrahymena thermophila (strain SB210) TaxID=312017 RepID=Q23F97_TETTS|nr:cation channel family protein [Tetrahymena thermophila SB210]EAR95256.3 cation channel family protein [Tetrahymena thermophila SB210]|eukprot:XP_001015501.3 cation channel family protein [Tetrahymena thermophila SB210]
MSNKQLQHQNSFEQNYQQGAQKRSLWTLNVRQQKINMDDYIYSSQSIQSNMNIKSNNNHLESNSFSKDTSQVDLSQIVTDSYNSKRQQNFVQGQSQDNKIYVSQQLGSTIQDKQNQKSQSESLYEQKTIIIQNEKKEQVIHEQDDCTSIYSKKLTSKQNIEDSVNKGQCLFERLGIKGKLTLSQSLALFFNIHRFVKKVKSTENNNFRNLTLSQHKYINDISSNYSYFLHNNKFRMTPTFFEQWKYKISQLDLTKRLSSSCLGRLLIKFAKKLDFVILPNSTFYTVFSVIMFVVILRIIIFIPIFLSQQEITEKDYEGSSYIWFNILSCLCFCLEILFKLNTAIYIRGELICRRRKIFKHLMKSKQLILDIFLTTIIIFISAYQMNYISFLLLLKVKDLQQTLMQLELKYQLKGNLQALIEMIKLIFVILFMAHIVACGAMFIQKIEISLGNNNAWFASHLSESWLDKYINAFYWSIVTMVTLGYGDIVPITLNEKLYAIGVALVGCFILSYSMNQVGEILNGLAKSSTLFKEKLQQLNNYFSKNYIERDLQLKVIKYYEYLQYEDQECINEGYKLIHQLPDQLKKEIQSKLYQNLFLNKKFFSLNFSKEFLHSLSLKIQEDVLHPRQVLYQKNEYPQRLYFILNGKIEIFFDATDKKKSFQVRKIKNKGEMIGEVEFFSNYQYELSAKSMSVANLAFIEKEDFLQELYKYPTDYEKFKMIQDQLCFKLYQKTGFMCQSCFSFKHRLNQCPYILYQSPKERIISLHLKSQGVNHRQSFQRTKLKSANTRSILMVIKQDAEILVQSLLFSQNEIILSKGDVQQQTQKPFTSSLNCNSSNYIGTKGKKRKESQNLTIYLNEDPHQITRRKMKAKLTCIMNQVDSANEGLNKIPKNNNFQSQALLKYQESELTSSKGILPENDNNQFFSQYQQQKEQADIQIEEKDETSINSKLIEQNLGSQNCKLEEQQIYKKRKVSYQYNDDKPIYQTQDDQKTSLKIIETNKQTSNNILSQIIIENSQRTLLFEQETLNEQLTKQISIQHFDLIHFDQGKDYLIYFPHNNLTKVLAQIDQIRKQKMQNILKAKVKKQNTKKIGKIEHRKRKSVFKQIKIESFSLQRDKKQI